MRNDVDFVVCVVSVVCCLLFVVCCLFVVCRLLLFVVVVEAMDHSLLTIQRHCQFAVHPPQSVVCRSLSGWRFEVKSNVQQKLSS